MKSFFQVVFINIVLVGSLYASDVSSYLYSDLKSKSSVKSALTKNGFTILGEYNAMGDANHHVIVYTSKLLTAAASKENRGFAAVQKVLINKKDKTLVLTNPEYFLRAFMQGDYDDKVTKQTMKKLSSAFGTFTKSVDAVDDDGLEGYHFMFGQPYYEDMEEVAEGKNLLSKLVKNAAGKIVFKLKLGKSTLVGLSMHTEDGEASYLKSINGQKHSAFLPYMVLIEDEKAKVLHPKYYLAISYPKLSMGDFMGIVSTPGNILDYITNFFK